VRLRGPGGGQEQTLAVVDVLGESEYAKEAATQRTVCLEPARHEGV
jgi:hypothetical protein